MNTPPVGLERYRTRLLLAIMLVVTIVTAAGVFFAQHNAAVAARRDFEREFQGLSASLHAAGEVRRALLAERGRALARKPRIHAALEDGALDLLYPSARDELADVMAPPQDASPYALHARYYRFLNSRGEIIVPPDARDVGALRPADEAHLTLPAGSPALQTGYLLRATDGGADELDEIVATPIVSSETGEAIATLVLGFAPVAPAAPKSGILSGVWTDRRLHLPALAEPARAALAQEISQLVAQRETSRWVESGDAPHLVFVNQLNPGSRFPAAYEVTVFPLADLLARQAQLGWRFGGAGALLLLGALGASHVLAARLSRPVEKLAVDSEANRRQLEQTHEELQRSARFSADASHQLKTPVTVLRAGLEELIANEQLSPETREEISALVHQTFRLSSVIEDLLLLSRMDAGRLKLDLAPVNLTQLIEAALDDLSARPDTPEIAVETDFPAALHIAGEKRYTSLILQNLLENARKYNRADGRIRVTAREAGGRVVLTIGNSGPAIPAAAQSHIFERFHRGAIGENVPGYGLGLNLARELARLHHGDLRLARSENDWTEFEVQFQSAAPPARGSA